MSMTALFWAALYCSAFVATFSNPIFGCLGYLLEYYMRPELKWWGASLPDLRYNLIISRRARRELPHAPVVRCAR